MENNNSKQVLFSIIGVAVLVVAVVGVSFAFFTYSRTGTTNNVITTGKIVFNFGGEAGDDGSKIDPDSGDRVPGNLVTGNSEPTDDGQASNPENPEKIPEFGFEVGGTIPDNIGAIDFKVYVVEGDLPKDEEGTTKKKPGGTEYTEEDRMSYEFVRLFVQSDSKFTVNAEDIDSTIEKAYQQNGNHKITDLSSGGKNLIASGTLQNDNTEHTYAYKLRMWVSDSITVSDTDFEAKYRASSTGKGVLPAGKSAEEDTRKVYSDLFYSVKIRIEANDQVGIGG